MTPEITQIGKRRMDTNPALQTLRKIILVGTTITAAAPLAAAADLSVKPPPTPVFMPYNWTGFYVGANAGYSWGSARADLSGTGGSITFLNLAPPASQAA